ncbi:T9SS type A sorting domain-containing protein [Seonamhaeicola sediminis]|uniref:T9SS type A sorting domain-containing protein n=1 Tax=Seonamhaeicola sediminis TaxID=2528206 RepID=A0A562YD60_9FLAO|nr:GEVED domain-containing protein [Seonamhaeicola sediminis]TWO32268.1 T9SS type A sorting domain-containing protein [Seonamhaeicola sediminis]
MKTKLHYVFSIAMFLMAFSTNAQNTTWEKLKTIENDKSLSKFEINKSSASFFKLNSNLFKKQTEKAPLRTSKFKEENTIILLPGIKGDLERFKIYEAPVFAPELSAKFPEIKSYVGFSLDNSGARLRMSSSPQGIQTMITYIDKPNVFMQPIENESDIYVLYDNSSTKQSSKLECKTTEDLSKSLNNNLSLKVDEGGGNDQTLQKFRIAISTTGEYTNFHGGTVAGALAAINATLTRVNEIFETDMAVTFELIANNNLIVYSNAGTDPYSDANVGVNGAWSGEVQSTLTSEIGEANYDIGHLFGASGGGGNAGCIGCVCINNSKGSAFTSPSNGVPQGDLFDLDFVAHEIGHQMGANHTWAFESEGTNVQSEPGSGSTIMAYAGLEGSNNVELNGDDYFHYHSIKQILDNLNGKSCQTTEVITNNPPSADAGSDYNIPKGTPYVLRGAATDPDGTDNLTYCWEQIDSGITNFLNFGPTLTTGPMNRSLPPTGSPNRYIPRFNSVLNGDLEQTNPTLGSDWETVASVSRILNWALTVRDRIPSTSTGGQSSFDTMQIVVEDVTPFSVENPVSWAQGSNQTISWVVGETTNATINCQNVNILLSTDGGVTFPTIIASSTPNDGAFDYTVPAIGDTNQARILIEAADNIFYDVSDFNFSISQNPDFFMVNETLTPLECGDSSATFTFDFVVANGFSETVTFSASGNPSGSTVSFSPTNMSASGSVTMTVSNLSSVPQNDYIITVTGTSTSITKNNDFDFPFSNGICTSIANTEYNTSTTLVEFNTINQSSGKPSGYSNYTATITNVNRNVSYNLRVNVNTDGNFTTNTKVWIDWNQNCSFDDAGEEYDLGDATNVSNGTTANTPLSITVPATAVTGNTTMRVSTKYKDDGLVTSCENGFDGEVEDYTINVLPNSTFDTSINLVQLNSINNASTKVTDYTDYTTISTELSRDSAYNLTVNVSTEGNFATNTKVWIDWNQNGSFNDTGEEYDLGIATNVNNSATSNSPLSITVPVDALLGTTTMRVVTGYDGAPLAPISNGGDGEVEDYTLVIVPTENIEQFGFENFVVYPNPNNGVFTIKLNGSLNRNIIIELFDSRGRFLFDETFQAKGDFKESINLNYVLSGMYILTVSDGVKKSLKKIVVK